MFSILQMRHIATPGATHLALAPTRKLAMKILAKSLQMGALAVAGTLLFSGCSILFPNVAANQQSDPGPAPQTQEAPAPAAVEDFTVGSDMFGPFPKQVGEYTLLEQPRASELGICDNETPSYSDGVQEMVYLTPEGEENAQALNAAFCWNVVPDQSEPYDQPLIGGISVFVDWALTDGTANETNCGSFEDAMFVTCKRSYEGYCHYVSVSANFDDLTGKEEYLTKFMDAVTSYEHFLNSAAQNGYCDM